MKIIKTQYFDTYNLLCIWHINKNVLKNCKVSFVTQKQWEEFLIAWYKVVYAHTRDEYKAVWITLIRKYNIEHKAKIKYLKNIWLNQWHARFCKYKTNEMFHFNTLTISRVKSDHRVLKIMLKFFTDDLMLVVDKFETFMNIQNQIYETILKQIKMRISIDLSRDLFKNLIERVSFYVLRKIKKQNKLIIKIFKKSNKHSLRSCTKVYEIIWEFSCVHIIEVRITAMFDKAEIIRLENIHSHWRFKKFDSSLTFINDFTSNVVDECKIDCQDRY